MYSFIIARNLLPNCVFICANNVRIATLIWALQAVHPFFMEEILALVFVVAASLFAIAYSLTPSKKKAAWPPSPPSLPLLGNLHQLSKGGNLLSALTAMAKTYGPVMTVWMGPSPIVVLTGQAPIWEALVNQASNFSGRPPLYSRRFTSASYRTMISSPYNQHWTKLRRLLHNNVLSPAHVALQSSSHQASVKKLISKLEKEMKERNGVVKPFYALKMMAMSFIAPLCFGPDFEDDDFLAQLEEYISEDIFLSKRGDMLLDQFHAARFFVPSSIKTERKWKSLRADVLRLMLPFIRFARSYREYLRRTAPSSFLSCLLSIGEEEEEMGEENSKLTDEEIAFNLYELFLLAVDSTSTAIEWALAYLITNPHVQERAYKEIVREDKDGLLCLEDLKKLPYMQSVVKETLRKESIAPLGMIHQTEEECKVMGVTIPAKSAVLFNLHSVSNDPEVWKDPNEFRPERFMEKNDQMENVRMAYLPFGAGRRVCAGMDVASVHVPITLANLLKTFKWDSAKEGILPDLTRDIPTVLMSMKYNLEARITPRP